jgi:hypothetical protein
MLLGNYICRMDAKRRFLLTDKQIDSLPHIIKNMNGRYKTAYLFAIADVLKLALELHGSIENIEWKINNKKIK